MSYEHGSIELGIKNPFKTEGTIVAIRGSISIVLGLIALFQVAGLVKEEKSLGWITAAIGLFLLTWGIKTIASGGFQLFRYFVGRSVPVSLAQNFAKSEREIAAKEKNNVFYSDQGLEEMLMGRKNKTFKEPEGWVARLLHTMVPKLTFVPYLFRNLALRVTNSLMITGVALICFALAWFVSVTGLVGAAGEFIVPMFSMLLMIYLLFAWSGLVSVFNHKSVRQLENLGTFSLAKIIAFSILAPVALGLTYDHFIDSGNQQHATVIASFFADNPLVSSGLYVMFILLMALISTGLIALLIRARNQLANPVTEVSELRENWQESVHPREIFINIETIVMANRRYKEVPNRLYRALEPQLKEQSDAKGSFDGEMIVENQPRVSDIPYDNKVKKIRLITTIVAHLFLTATAVLLFFSNTAFNEAFNALLNMPSTVAIASVPDFFNSLAVSLSAVSPLANILLCGLVFLLFGHLLAVTAHVFWAEMWFESLIVYFRCEGTFTESKLSTGTSIYDSTRSENNVVRSSMTPWIIVSKIKSSIFAESGRENLESPRLVIEMHKDSAELADIVSDMKSFLGDREAIASIKNDKDLASTSNIYQINEQTRMNTERALASDQQLTNQESDKRKTAELPEEVREQYQGENEEPTQ